jgi:Protein of unknown function (DUF998)
VPRGDLRRAVVGCALTGVITGGAGLVVAVLGPPGLSGYVSEAGVPGTRYAPLYRISLLLIAVALALLAQAARGIAGAAPVLALAAPLAALSAAVTCTPGCPLPPHHRPTPADLVHAGASIAALALCVVAMGMFAISASDRALRLGSLVAALVTAPLLLAGGLAVLLVGRSLTTGVLERAGLVPTLAWLVLAGVRLLVDHSGRMRTD